MKRTRKSFRYYKKMAIPYILLFPVVGFVMVFMFWPIVNVFILSLQNYEVMKPAERGFVGLQNYMTILTQDKLFVKSWYNSFIWVVVSTVIQAVLGFWLSTMLNKKFRGRGFVRAMILSPWAISGVITAIIWSLIFGQQYGLLNDILKRLGMITENISWFSDGSRARIALIIANVWRGLPFFVINYLSALQTVPDDLYEAADMEGATGFQKTFRITVPVVKDSIIVTTLLRAIWTFNAVDLIFSLTGGGPGRETMTYTLYIMNKFKNELNYGYASALAAIATVCLCIFSLIYIKISKMGKEALY